MLLLRIHSPPNPKIPEIGWLRDAAEKKCSSDFFSGFEVDIAIRYFETIDQIIYHFKNELQTTLQKYHFDILYEKCVESNFHIHTHTFDWILMNNSEIIYICDGCDRD